MRLSKNFTLRELTHSNAALRLGIDNTPTQDGIHKLTIIANSLLQPIRKQSSIHQESKNDQSLSGVRSCFASFG